MSETFLKKLRRRLLHLVAALSVGAVLAALVAVSLMLVFLYFFPGEPDDAGFSGAAAIGVLIISAYVGLPLFSSVAYWLLRGRFAQKQSDVAKANPAVPPTGN